MSKSNITLPPKKNEISTVSDLLSDAKREKKISEIINKGGSPTKIEEALSDSFKNFNIKILESELASINRLRDKRPRARNHKRPGITIHDWIIEAIKEKIDRETKKLNT